MSEDITHWLQRAAAGDAGALDQALPLLYGELRQLARAQRRGEATLTTTALVHEAYIKLVGQEGASWADRRHFFAYAAKAMRSLLADALRRRLADKRGGTAQRDDDALLALSIPDAGVDYVAIDQALTELDTVSPRLAEVVELHVYAGLGFNEIASCMQVTERTVFRDWRKARALLEAHFTEHAPH